MTDKTPTHEAWTHLHALHALHRFHSPAVPTPPPPFELPDGSFDSAAYLAWLNSK